tara:strand:+ start:343 stop:729 length:387 start_codon:yes stop_codon:yes gene_type:complete
VAFVCTENIFYFSIFRGINLGQLAGVAFMGAEPKNPGSAFAGLWYSISIPPMSKSKDLIRENWQPAPTQKTTAIEVIVFVVCLTSFLAGSLFSLVPRYTYKVTQPRIGVVRFPWSFCWFLCRSNLAGQ